MGIIKVKTKFRIKYDPKNAKYYSENKNAKELFEKLLSSSNKRCMYCGRNLYLMGTEMKGLKLEEVFFNREHTVNKKQDGIEYENLKHCKFNLAVACPICNNTKSKIINVEKKLLEKLQEKVCEEKECLSPCKEYLEVLKDFEEKNKIILQPLGLDRKEEHDIVYNTENLTFEINQEEDYSEREKNIINNHISRFLQKFEKKCLKGVIQVLVECNYGKNLPDKKDIEKENRFNTVVEENFLDYLEKLNYLQREAIIKKIERKIKNSNEGRSYEEIIL